MTQRELFDAFGRLPEAFRLEALENPEPDAADEIDVLFEQNLRQYTESARQPAEKEEVSRSEEIKDINRAVRKKEQNPLRNLTIGLTAVAAVIALTVGAMVWRVHRETIDTIGSPSAASSVQQAVTEMQMQTDAQGSQITETAAADDAQEQSVTGSPADSAEAAQSTETNLFGGKGALRIVGVQNSSSEPITEDDEYWYIGGRSRISKTVKNEQGKLEEELICRTPGCLHNLPDCLYYRYGNLLSDGEEIYLPSLTKQGMIEENGRLARLNPDGTDADFFQIEKDEIIEGFTAEGNTIVHHEYEKIYYYDILKLGDSGNYLIQGQLQHNETGNKSITFNVLFTPATGKKVFLPWEFLHWQYDAAGGQLFCIRYKESTASSVGYVKDAQFLLYDIRTGECIRQSGTFSCVTSAVILDGRVYYIRRTDRTVTIISDGQPNGGRLEHTESFYTYDFASGENTVLQEDTDYEYIYLCGGRLIFVRQAHVGKDQIVILNPDDMSEEILYETPNKIMYLRCCTNPDFLYIRGTFTDGFIVNGELRHIQFGNF